MDCGEAHIPDVSPWTPGEHVGEAVVFSDNCYLIRHGRDWMLWDSGYADAVASHPEGVAGARNARVTRRRTLASQLAEIGLVPGDIRFIAFSHMHADHVGNADLFPRATLYIQRAEHDAAFGPDPARYGFVPATYAQLRANPVVELQGDFDVFGDGSVQILATPGHTPGHQSLLVRLAQTGVVVLSGDAAHFQDNFVRRRVPAFNFDADASRRSMDKLDAIVHAEHAQLWINHDARQTATLRHAPQYYE
jgi:glyoxylase-like metal-dependent hydrolase (beta-lactamase superfamily II)